LAGPCVEAASVSQQQLFRIHIFLILDADRRPSLLDLPNQGIAIAEGCPTWFVIQAERPSDRAGGVRSGMSSASPSFSVSARR